MKYLTFKYLNNNNKLNTQNNNKEQVKNEINKNNQDNQNIIKYNNKSNNKIEYIFYITLALLLLYEIIILNQNNNIITINNQKGGNPLFAIFKGISVAAKTTGKVAAKTIKTTAKVGYKSSKLLTKVASKIGNATSNILSSAGSTVSSTVGATVGATVGSVESYSNNNNVSKKSVSKGIKSINTGISEKESYKRLMQNQQSSKGKIFVFGVIICFFSFLLLSVLPIFSIIIILIISFAYAKDEFVKFIKKF